MVEIVEGDRQSILSIANGLIALESGAYSDRSVGEAELQKNLFAHEVLVGASGHACDHIIEHTEAEVGVFEFFAGRGDEIAVAQNGLVHRGTAIRLVDIEELIVQRQARRVIGHTANGCLGGVTDAGAELDGSEIVIYGAVEIDL